MKTFYLQEWRKYTKYDILENKLEGDKEAFEKLLKYAILDEKKGKFQVKFVGVIIVNEFVINCYPKYIPEDIDEPKDDFKQVLKVIKKYRKLHENIDYQNEELEDLSYNQLSMMIFFLEDYYEMGIYTNTQKILQINGNGEIDWDRTVNYTYPLIKDNKPIQYVIGNVNFCGNVFKVNKNVLIPRFETEELVDNTLKYIQKYFKLPVKIIDLGSGSGNIGLTLKQKLPNAEVDLIDISPSALEMSKKNAEEFKLDANIYKSDFFDQVEGKYDVVISNPPYIKDGEEIEDIVKNNEPELALFAGVDGLDCYKKIFKGIKGHLNNRFLIALEIGKDQKEDLIKIINDTFDKVRIDVLQDLSERDRMIFIYNE